MYTSGTIANSQMTPTKINNKNGAIAKVRVLVEQVILAINHLKTFKMIFNEMSILLLILY